ncbi:L-threonylcarbamoyladenylate synthase [Peribacillus cavernae]|uniref:L-threonylcarbamoyladenylate synthase n=1 Tax=Peribacillus cavernae TaxID=1674310 RepID=UPI00163B927C|nr:L-threonylcarbamoyladenylate synthase [Peribacillus cavernae]MDQ0218519.1 L-threonylcarbamoyladenylate synthase [Peribacillus cavernae]
MKTEFWTVDKNVDNLRNYPQITQSTQMLIRNEVVAFPTETVYGLGANAKSDEAVKKVFMAKGRPGDNPLIVHIASRTQLDELVEDVPGQAERLIEAFWPGPLTLIFNKKQGKLSDLVTAGLETVAIRMPDHPVALCLIQESGLPIAAPSANTSGRPSPTTAQHVKDDLSGKIAAIVDGGATGIGVESTVLDCTENTPVILRPGGVTREEIEAVIGEVRVDAALKNKAAAPKSPGMKYTHYAPKAPFILVDGNLSFMQELIDEKKLQGLKVGVFIAKEHENEIKADYILAPGTSSDLYTVATGLYDTLRKFDELEADFIFGEVFPVTGIGEAIMNRLLKAAGHEVVKQM